MANQIPLIVNAGAGQIQQLATEDNLSVTANVVTGNILAGGYFYANGQPFSGGSGSGNTTWANIGNINNSYGPTQIAIGLQAGTSQGTSAIAIGEMAGSTGQRAGGVAVGATAGSTNQGNNAVAIGGVAGYNNQGANAIAIGFGAGQSNQPNNTVILNATGSAFNGVSGQQNSFYVPTVRNNTTGNALYYNPGTGEITFAPPSGGGNATPGGSDTQIQFNSNGAFGGSDSFTFDGTNVIITANNFVANPGAYILQVQGLSGYLGSLTEGGVGVAYATTTLNTQYTNITSANTTVGGNIAIGDASQSTPGNSYIVANASGVTLGITASEGITLNGNGIQIGGTGGANIFGVAGAEVVIGGSTGGQVTVLSAINSSNTITATSFSGDGSNLTNLPQTYGDSNVTSLLASGNITTNITTLNYLNGNNISASGNITSAGKVITVADNLSDGAVSGAGLIAGANTATILYDNSVFGWTVNQGWHPAANTTYNLGRPTRYWNNLYSVNVTADYMDIVDGLASNAITSGTFLLANAGSSTYSVVQRNQNPPLGTEAFGIEMLTTTDNPAIYSSVSAGSDYVGMLSSNAGNANVIAQGGYGVTVSTSNATGGNPMAWTFAESGELFAPGDISSTGNVLAQGIISTVGNIITDGYFVGNFAGNITGNIVVPGSNTQVLFNTNGNVDAVGGLTYNKDSNTLTILGNVSAQGAIYGATFNGNGSNLTNLYSNATIITLGLNAGGGSYANSVAIGYSAGDQGANSVAIGSFAGANAQGSYSVAIGRGAAESAQGNISVAIGRGAGFSSQGDSAVAIGQTAGNSTQGTQAIAIGLNAGANSQTGNSISIGVAAGTETQGDSSISIGYLAGGYYQGINSVAVGRLAGNNTQGSNVVAVGYLAGSFNSGDDTIAIGTNAGNNTQGNGSVAIGRFAGNNQQGANSVALGRNAGNITQGTEAVALGHSAGNNQQGIAAVAIGFQAGFDSQASYAVAIGAYAGNLNMGANAVAIGSFAGYPNSANNSVAINGNPTPLDAPNAGFYVAPVRNDTGNVTNVVYYNTLTNEVTYGPTTIGSSIVNGNSNVSISTAGGNIDLNVNGNPFGSLGFGVALGYNAGGTGNTALQESGIAIGTSAGNTSQGLHSIAVGWNTGEYLQGNSAVAIGENAAFIEQGNCGIAIGAVAGREAQSANAIAIGTRAGLTTQGLNAIAIGANAASNAQPNNSIAIVASGIDPVPTNSGLYVDPVRNDTGNVTNAVYYNTTTKEVTYGPAGGSSVAEAPFSIQTNNFAAVSGSRYGVDTTGGGWIATLPSSPATGAAIFFADAGGAYSTNPFVVDPNGGTIMGSSGSMTVSTNGQSFGLFYNGTTWRTYN